MTEALKHHWPEYLIEALSLGLFMISAFSFATLLEHPSSPVHQAIANPTLRRFLMGLAMGGTAIAIIYSPWGQQSGAHINPSMTFTFFWLGKIAAWDTVFYVAGQFLGGTAGAVGIAFLLHPWAAHASINYVVTMPGAWGSPGAFAAEIIITFVLMMAVLHVSNHSKLHKFTGLCAGGLVAAYITIEAPVSGMSMNPARSFASAFAGNSWSSLWIYFTAPLIGMLAAAEVYVRRAGLLHVSCAKLHHENAKRCIFCGKPAT
jgi:aquaporin Z